MPTATAKLPLLVTPEPTNVLAVVEALAVLDEEMLISLEAVIVLFLMLSSAGVIEIPTDAGRICPSK